MFRLQKVQEQVGTDFVYKTTREVKPVYTVKPITDKAGRILNKKEYYAGIEKVFVEKKLSYPVENTEYFRIKNDYMTMINAFREKDEDQFIGGMPVQIQEDCIKQLFRINKFTNKLTYSVTLKVDGERYLMMVGLDSQVVFIDRSTNIFYLINNHKERARFSGIKAPFLLDGELVLHANGEYEYLVFDLLFYPNKNKKLMSYVYDNYDIRYTVAKECINSINKYSFPGFKVTLKTWYPITSILNTKGKFYEYITNLTNDERKAKGLPLLNADGLILQPNDGNYVTFREWNNYNNIQFKWKPPDELTIDFKIRVVDNKWYLLTQTDQQYMINQPNASNGQKVPPVPAMCIPSEEDFKKYRENEVVEFKYFHGSNPFKNLFVPVRSRNEKKANSYRTIMSTLDVIQHPFYLDSLRECFEIITSNRITVKSDMKIFLKKVFSSSDLVLYTLNTTNGIFFNKKDQASIKKIYEDFEAQDSTNFELEFRIFSYAGLKKSNMTKSTFFYLLDFCWRSFPVKNYNSIDIILNKADKKKKHRSTYMNLEDIQRNNPIQNITKTSLLSYTNKPDDPDGKYFNNLAFKIDLSTEIHTDRKINVSTEVEKSGQTNFIRIKNRKSFKVNDLWVIDLTQVKSSYSRDILRSDTRKLINDTYECELEYIGPGTQETPGAPIPYEDFLQSINKLYLVILSNSGYC